MTALSACGIHLCARRGPATTCAIRWTTCAICPMICEIQRLTCAIQHGLTSAYRLTCATGSSSFAIGRMICARRHARKIYGPPSAPRQSRSLRLQRIRPPSRRPRPFLLHPPPGRRPACRRCPVPCCELPPLLPVRNNRALEGCGGMRRERGNALTLTRRNGANGVSLAGAGTAGLYPQNGAVRALQQMVSGCLRSSVLAPALFSISSECLR